MDSIYRDIVDSATIAVMFGVSRQAVSQWRSRKLGFPEPLTVPGVINPLFSRAEVIAWHRNRN